MAQLKASKSSASISAVCRTLGALFILIAVLTLLSAVLFGSRHFFSRSLMYASFAGFNGMLAYGFWKMQKWVVSFLGATVLLVLASDFINAFSGVQRIGQMLTGFVIVFALFLFAYFSRSFLKGEYKNIKALSLFLVFLILSQVAIFLIK